MYSYGCNCDRAYNKVADDCMKFYLNWNYNGNEHFSEEAARCGSHAKTVLYLARLK